MIIFGQRSSTRNKIYKESVLDRGIKLMPYWKWLWKVVVDLLQFIKPSGGSSWAYAVCAGDKLVKVGQKTKCRTLRFAPLSDGVPAKFQPIYLSMSIRLFFAWGNGSSTLFLFNPQPQPTKPHDLKCPKSRHLCHHYWHYHERHFRHF